jgi:hypothetical protein
LSWDEVEKIQKKRDPGLFVFEAPQVLERVEKVGDLFEPVLKLKQKLPKLGDLLASGRLKENEREVIAGQAARRAEEMARKAERRGPPPPASASIARSSRKSSRASGKPADARALRKRVR